DDERLLSVLQNPSATLADGSSALLTLTGWDPDSASALLTQFFNSTALTSLSSVASFRRIFDAYAVVKACRAKAATLIASVTNAPSAALVNALQSALRALYAGSDWLAVIRPINDAVRIQQRDALVAYILQRLGDNSATASINTPNKLFQYLLIDSGMQP